MSQGDRPLGFFCLGQGVCPPGFLVAKSQGDRPPGSFFVWARGPDPLAHVMLLAMIGMVIINYEGGLDG
ncbi:hypothetical protein B14911_16645 [Bacillus sp. NRRL B-14911]|uniref:Uncharacterized protein n=1 Tax=Bacillus infantis NRRL B-14911 TaxID=1367477 RepID=U5L5Y6_9BACI|nr:hypothetical protein N288_04290 [Bacillus infantis NRRL B-14911]EAR67160.1 hypothetical protein B14911_16645 [Bacillus sp. NRRL B-14911]